MISSSDRLLQAEEKQPKQRSFNGIAAVIVLGAFLSAVPLWIVKYPPMQDYPNHLACAYVLAHLSQPASNFTSYYRADWGTKPYIVGYGLLVGLQRTMPIELAGKLVLSLCVIATPIAGWFFIREANPGAEANSVWCLLAAYTPFLLAGFFSFQLSIAICCVFWGLWLRYMRTQQNWVWLLNVLIATTLYFSHLMAFLVAMLVVAIHWLLTTRNLRALLLRFAWFAPGLAFIFAQFLRPGSHVESQSASPMHRLLTSLEWIGPREKAVRFGAPFIANLTSIHIAATLLFVLGLLACYWRNPQLSLKHPWIKITALLSCLFLAMPDLAGVMADARLSIFILVIALAAFDPGRRKKWFFVCGVMAASLHLLDVTQNFIRSQASIETTLEALASIPPGSKVLPLVRRPANEHLQRAPTVHLWAYGVIRKNWISPYLFHGEGVLPLEATSTLYIPRWVDADGRFAVPLNWDRVRV
jgi:hypothetical protein